LLEICESKAMQYKNKMISTVYAKNNVSCVMT